jgi:hypothetical protein
MTACDARARQVEEYFTGQLAEVATFEWTSAGQVLVVDNRRALTRVRPWLTETWTGS